MEQLKSATLWLAAGVEASAAIVVLRTALNLFLQLEIDKAEARRTAMPPSC